MTESRPEPRRLYRGAENRLLGGVCEGLSKHTGIDVWLVRAAFVVSCLFAASGALAYAGFWLFVPLEMDPRASASGAGGAGTPGAAAGMDAGLGSDAGTGMGTVVGASAAAPAPGVVPAGELSASADLDYARCVPRPGSRHSGRPGPAAKAAILALLVGGLFLLIGAEAPGLQGHWSAIGLLGVVCAGLALIWRQADDEQRARWPAPAQPLRRRDMARAALGAVVVLGGISALVASNTSWQQAIRALIGAVALLAGVVLITLPYLLRVVRDLSAERAERIRSQERAEVAAMMHDSVLHTLALIQRKSADPVQVAKLARAQERDLRGWLYADRGRASGAATGSGPTPPGPTRPGSSSPGSSNPGSTSGSGAHTGSGSAFGSGANAVAPTTFAAAVQDAIAQVEDRHGVPIEVVAVGDAPLDDGLRACVAAAREAAVNAAKYAAGAAITVYAEVEVVARAAFDGRGVGERTVSAEIYVRDRGPGFDLDAVAADRMGIRESIVGRMKRHGGKAAIRTAPGEGTEVRLVSRAGNSAGH